MKINGVYQIIILDNIQKFDTIVGQLLTYWMSEIKTLLLRYPELNRSGFLQARLV
jgi:hypothetical protein